MRSILGWLVLLELIVLIGAAAISHSMGRTSPDLRVLGAIMTIAMGLAVFIPAYRAGLNWHRLFGGRPSARELTLIAVIVPVALLMFASALLTFVPLSYLAPNFVEHTLLSSDLYSVETVSQWLVLMLLAVVLAPVIEEVLFRGILMQRFAYKWGTRTGVIASSVLFAIGHGEWLGHFVFGVAMCALYLRTRKLRVNIAAHALNNFVVVAPSLWPIITHQAQGAEAAETLAHFRSQFWLFAPILVAALVLGWWYLRRWWPNGVGAVLRGPTPYDAADLTGAGASEDLSTA